MKWVRDTKGLTYGIGSKIKREHGTGVLRIEATFALSLLEEGLRESNKVITEWFSGNVTQQEVDIQKQILLGSRLVHFDNPHTSFKRFTPPQSMATVPNISMLLVIKPCNTSFSSSRYSSVGSEQFEDSRCR